MYFPFCHSYKSNYFDDIAERLVAWEVEIYQLEKGKFTNALEQFATRDVLLTTAQFGGHTHQIGSPPPGRKFAFVAEESTHLNWRKHNISEDSLMIFPKGGDLDVITPTGMTEVITISCNDRLLKTLMPELCSSSGKPSGDINSLKLLCLPRNETTFPSQRPRFWQSL